MDFFVIWGMATDPEKNSTRNEKSAFLGERRIFGYLTVTLVEAARPAGVTSRRVSFVFAFCFGIVM